VAQDKEKVMARLRRADRFDPSELPYPELIEGGGMGSLGMHGPGFTSPGVGVRADIGPLIKMFQKWSVPQDERDVQQLLGLREYLASKDIDINDLPEKTRALLLSKRGPFGRIKEGSILPEVPEKLDKMSKEFGTDYRAVNIPNFRQGGTDFLSPREAKKKREKTETEERVGEFYDVKSREGRQALMEARGVKHVPSAKEVAQQAVEKTDALLGPRSEKNASFWDAMNFYHQTGSEYKLTRYIPPEALDTYKKITQMSGVKGNKDKSLFELATSLARQGQLNGVELEEFSRSFSGVLKEDAQVQLKKLQMWQSALQHQETILGRVVAAMENKVASARTHFQTGYERFVGRLEREITAQNRQNSTNYSYRDHIDFMEPSDWGGTKEGKVYKGEVDRAESQLDSTLTKAAGLPGSKLLPERLPKEGEQPPQKKGEFKKKFRLTEEGK
jgi:hypothetical protein